MFKDQQGPPPDPLQEMLEKIAREIDDIKRYVAATYDRVDTEIDEIRSLVQRVHAQVTETDRQVDKIEAFERAINETKIAVQRLERKIK